MPKARSARFLGVFALAAMLVGCGGGPVSTWSTPKDVLDSLRQAGFTCMSDEGAEPLIVPAVEGEGPEAVPTTTIGCDGYAVQIWSDTEAVDKVSREFCSSPDITAEDWVAWEEREGVAGPNWFIYHTEEDWPVTAKAVDFQKAFGGDIENNAQYFERIGCTRPA